MFRYKKKKRAILLLEILIALAIVSLCAIPIVRHPILFFRSQILSLHKMEFERIADLTFLEIKAKLYRKEIKWDKIPFTSKNCSPETLSPYLLKVEGLAPVTIKREFILYYKHEKLAQNNSTYRLVHISIALSSLQHENQKKIFKYRVLAEKSFAEKNPPESL